MKNKVYRLFSLALLALMLVFGSCKKISQIEPTSFSLDSINPRGLRAVTVNMTVGVNNPAPQITLSEISGQALVSGKVIGNVAMDPVVLLAKKDTTYKIKADVTLAEGVSVFEVIAYTRSKEALENATANIYATAKLKGLPAKKIKMEEVPLKQLLDNLKR